MFGYRLREEGLEQVTKLGNEFREEVRAAVAQRRAEEKARKEREEAERKKAEEEKADGEIPSTNEETPSSNNDETEESAADPVMDEDSSTS